MGARILFVIIIFPVVALSQIAYKPSKAELTSAYKKAIGDFIKATGKKHKSKFDTLFFAKRQFGQADDFPDITLPGAIENVQIRLVKPEAGERKQKERKSLVYINLLGWVLKEKAEFIFVVFSDHGVHQYDCFINYKYDQKRNLYEIEKLRFEYFKYQPN